MSSSERAAQDAADSQSGSVAEHQQPKARPGYTFWHHYLAAIMQHRLASPALEVRAFEKLGTLPLEADIIILRRRADVDLTGLAPDFEFLLKLLRDILVVEYKSPKDRLQLADLDTVRAYAMLCKRKFSARYDESVAVVMMYSSVDSDFFADCARNGHPFVETEPGVSACTDTAVKYYAVNLVQYGATRPADPLLLFSSQYRRFRPAEGELGLFQAIFEEVTYKELKHMAQSQFAVKPEGFEELHKWFLQSCTVEERLEGISAEERLRGLPAEERLRGLTTEQRTQLLALLQNDPRN